MFLCRVHKSSGETILAIADKDLKGKTFEEGDFTLSVNEFYGNSVCTKEEILELIESATMINAVGKNTINFLESRQIIDNKMIITIDKIPHAQVITLT